MVSQGDSPQRWGWLSPWRTAGYEFRENVYYEFRRETRIESAGVKDHGIVVEIKRFSWLPKFAGRERVLHEQSFFMGGIIKDRYLHFQDGLTYAAVDEDGGWQLQTQQPYLLHKRIGARWILESPAWIVNASTSFVSCR